MDAFDLQEEEDDHHDFLDSINTNQYKPDGLSLQGYPGMDQMGAMGIPNGYPDFSQKAYQFKMPKSLKKKKGLQMKKKP